MATGLPAKRNALHDAAEFGTYDNLINALYPKLVNQQTPQGSTPLHLAVMANRWWAVREILRLKANPNIQDSWGDTPLHKASRKQSLLIFQMLLSAKCDVSIKNKTGETAMHIAVNEGHVRIVRELLESRMGNVNERDGLGRTALHLATQKGSSTIARMLVKANADIQALTPDGETPLQLAVKNGLDRNVLGFLTQKV